MSESDGLWIRFCGNKAEALFAGLAPMSDYNHHDPEVGTESARAWFGCGVEEQLQVSRRNRFLPRVVCRKTGFEAGRPRRGDVQVERVDFRVKNPCK
jgi:hypothetical protein